MPESAGEPAISTEARINLINIRSMEFCRRWGIEEEIRQGGFPGDYPMTVVFATSMRGKLLKRLPYPSMADQPALPFSPTNRQRIPQHLFDPVFRRALGCDFPFEVLGVYPWARRAVVARNYRKGRCFLVGDSAHQLSPMARRLRQIVRACTQPSARPGGRAPHAWLLPGRSTLDLFGRGFVLLDGGADENSLRVIEEAAAAVSVPLSITPLRNAAAASLYQRKLTLVRPDGHVAWRGDRAPENARALMNVIRGAASRTSSAALTQSHAK